MLSRYTDVEEYYVDGSSEGYVPLIKTPTLYLASADDPFVGRLPIAECSANPHTVLAVTSR
jgi:abhydrolase domain-containing protein 1/3